MRSLLFILVAVPMAAVSAAKPAVPIEWKPDGNWTLDYADNRCTLARKFSRGDEQSVFAVSQYWPGEAPRWTLAGPAVASLGKGRKTSVEFGPQFAAFETEFESATLDGFGPAIFGRDFERKASERETETGRPDVIDNGTTQRGALTYLDPDIGSGVRRLTVTQKGRSTQVFLLGDMADAYKALNSCTEDLVQHLGFDTGKLAMVRKRASLNSAHRFKVVRRIRDHYPVTARHRGESVDMLLLMRIGADGRVLECRTTEITKAASFDTYACDTFKQLAQFDPARDSNGNAVDDIYEEAIIYRVR